MTEEQREDVRVVMQDVTLVLIVDIVSGQSVTMIVLDVAQLHLCAITHVARHRDVPQMVVAG